MTYDWSPLKHELALWRAERLTLPLWWRDDDAVAPTRALDRLAGLSGGLGLDVHLAVIPKHATPALAGMCQDAPFVPVVHGWTHENRTLDGGKKAEFGTWRADAAADLAAALARMQTLFGADVQRMFVPPWNRIAPEIVSELRGLGYQALSTYTPRKTPEAAPGLVQINTHVDPIHWRGGGGLADADGLIAGIVQTLVDRREGRSDPTEPLGFLTHHLVHDAAIWGFSEACLAVLLDGGAVPSNIL